MVFQSYLIIMAFQSYFIIMAFLLLYSASTLLVTAETSIPSQSARPNKLSERHNALPPTVMGGTMAAANSALSAPLYGPVSLSNTGACCANDSVKILRRRESPYRFRGQQHFVGPNEYATWMMEAMGEMWMMALAARNAMGSEQSPSTSFLRYFNRRQFCSVMNAFDTLLGGDDNPIDGPDELQYVTIYWSDVDAFRDYRQLPTSASCRRSPSKLAWCASGDYRNPLLHLIMICPPTYSLRTTLRDFDCNRISRTNRAADRHFLSGGQMLLHELMHRNFVGRAAIGAHIPDFEPPPNQWPRSGYGPFNAMQVNHRRNLGTANADNYAWFALEAFLLQDNELGCGGTKMDPPLSNFINPIDCSGDPLCQGQLDTEVFVRIG